MKTITYKTQNVIGSGDVILTVLAERMTGKGEPGASTEGETPASGYTPVSIFFKGLYVAIYAKA
ncbi:MAG: hypothetical protein ACRER2_09950 [Methylococcales bacterium]